MGGGKFNGEDIREEKCGGDVVGMESASSSLSRIPEEENDMGRNNRGENNMELNSTAETYKAEGSTVGSQQLLGGGASLSQPLLGGGATYVPVGSLPRSASSVSHKEDMVDRVLIQIMEGKVVGELTPILITDEPIPDESVENSDSSDTLFDLEEEDVVKIQYQIDSIASIEEEYKLELVTLGLEYPSDVYTTLLISEAEDHRITHVTPSRVERDERTKRPTKPSPRIQEILDHRAELEEKKRILLQLKDETVQKRAARKAAIDAKKQLRAQELNQIIPAYAESVNVNSSQMSRTSSVETTLGLMREELHAAGELLSRQEITGGSDLSMMAKLYKISSDPYEIGNLPQCTCWICGFPMLTKPEYSDTTRMIKRVHGQVSPEHTLPVAAGNALIGLATKEFYKKYDSRKQGFTEAITFLKKGLTFSHFWCNEVKNALRLVSWPKDKLPEPNDRNIKWLLDAMWNGIKRTTGIRWFDQSACFVVYTPPGGSTYKFSNLVHFFVLKDKVGVSSAALQASELGKEWKRKRFEAIKGFLTGICDDIERYTRIYCEIDGNNDPTLGQLVTKLKEIYRDRVVKGVGSDYDWPPALASHSQRGNLSRTRRGSLSQRGKFSRSRGRGGRGGRGGHEASRSAVTYPKVVRLIKSKSKRGFTHKKRKY